jgi:thiol-disulfide isomerase/thioredoxin
MAESGASDKRWKINPTTGPPCAEASHLFVGASELEPDKPNNKKVKRMIKRIASLAAIIGALTLVTTGAFAGEVKPYSQSAFNEAKAAGKTVLLDFHADWCPVCKKQGPIIQSLVQDDKFKDIAVFKVDYDNEKALKQQLKVTNQSTLVVFKGDKAVARSTWVTDQNQIRALIEKGL